MDLRLLAAQPTLHGPLVRLEPLGPEHVDGLWPLHEPADPGPGSADTAESTALARERVLVALARASERADRADWAIVRVADDRVVGEAVLFELDEDHASMSYRIALIGPEVFDRGYGGATTRLVRDFAFGPLGLHRLALHVEGDNARAVHVYERAGFVVEGRRRAVVRRGGEWVDVLDLGLLASDPMP